jgi:hypothetical protein
MKITTINKIAIVIIGMAFIALANLGRAQTVIYTDNFNIPDTTSLDTSVQTGRHTGLLATNVVGQSGGIELTITSQQLNLLRTGGGSDGRMRFCDVTNGVVNTSGRHDWASGAAGAAITAAGGMRIDFDWTAPENTNANWISYSVGITPNSDVATRVANSGTDSGILFRDNGAAQVFQNGTAGATNAFNVTSLSHHVELDYAFSSWADGSPVTLNAYVDSVLILSQTFTWNGNGGVQNMEISSLVSVSIIDNFSVQTFAPPNFLNVTAVSDSPATNYVGHTVNFIGTVSGTQPITNQWMVNKGSGFVNVSASATNTTLTLTNQVSDTGTYELFASNAAGHTNSGPLPLTVLNTPTNSSINVQFTGSWLSSGNAPAQTNAAVIGNNGDVWNQISNPTGGTSPAGLAKGTNLAVVDVGGVGTTLTMDYVGDYVFNGAAFGYSNPFIDAVSPVAPLMTGYMGSVSTAGADTNTVTVRNLKPGTYDLYLYACGRSDGQTRVNVFTANGLTAVCGPNSGNSSLIAGTNYVHLTPTVTANGLLNISYYGTADAGQALMNGFQLNGPITLPVPPFPSSDTTCDSPATNYVGRNVTFLAGFGGYPTPALQWKVNKGSGFVNVSANATNSTLTLSAVPTTASGSYALFATNIAGASNSTPLSLTVLAAPTNNFGMNVNVQFAGSSRGSDVAAPQVGPAVIGNAGDFWNPVINPNPVLPDTSPIFGNGQILSDASGIGTTLTLDYTGNADLNTGINNPFFASGSPAENLMKAALVAENTSTATVTLHDLLPGAYDLYLYSLGGNGGGQTNVTDFAVAGIAVAAGPNNGNTSLTENVNYVHLTPTVTGNGLLNISLVGTETVQAQLNGFQLSGPGAFTLYVILDIQRNGSQLTLTWPNGKLLESTNVLGPWTTNAATSPFTFTPALSPPEKFYRVKVQ